MISVRFTPEMAEAAMEIAHKAGLTRTEWIRGVVGKAVVQEMTV